MRGPLFKSREAFQAAAPYQLLPFRFGILSVLTYVLTNDVGEYVVLTRDQLVAFAERRLLPDAPTYQQLKSKHFLFDATSRVSLDLLALKYRTRAERLASFTALHMFVVTLRCDHSCHYCQVSRQTEDRTSFDMSEAHAERALSCVFRSPAQRIKIEFQGGEPLLNFELIRYVVEHALQLNDEYRRDIQFVIATNLSRLTKDVLDYCKRFGICLSTSLDGPEQLHCSQRPMRTGNSYERTIEGIRAAREALGPESVSALMTTTQASLDRVEEIVDEYVRQGFHSIFLRNISPYGFAVRGSLNRQYDVARWIEFYKRGLAHILEVNRRGYAIREEYTSILLQRIHSPLDSGYVDLQSPAGIGIGALVYNYDGAVYASDEGRMLAEMGDHSFRLGHLDRDSYDSMMTSDALLSPLFDSMLEGAPMCCECPFLPYCGADPVFHTATQNDPVGHKAFSAFCEKQTEILRHLILLLQNDPMTRETFMSWV